MPIDEGSLNRRLERESDAIAERAAHQILLLRKAHSGRPAYTFPLDRQEQAALELPQWYVYGQADLFDHQGLPLGILYWANLVRGQSGAIGPDGPLDVLAYDQGMRHLYDNPKYTLAARKGMTPDDRRVLVFLCSMGLHPGRVRPTDEQARRITPIPTTPREYLLYRNVVIPRKSA